MILSFGKNKKKEQERLLLVKKEEESQREKQRIAEVMEGKIVSAKKILKDWEQNRTKLHHVQLDLLAKSLGLQIRHYTEFLGKMPEDKIFSMPTLRKNQTVFKVVDVMSRGWGGVEKACASSKHGLYHSVKELEAVKKHFSAAIDGAEKIEVLTTELPAVFVLAPEELFTDQKDILLKLDPIIVEMTGDDEYEVCSFWNVPEKVAVNLADPKLN